MGKWRQRDIKKLWVFAIFLAICVNGCQARKVEARQAEALEEMAFIMDKWDSTGVPQ